MPPLQKWIASVAIGLGIAQPIAVARALERAQSPTRVTIAQRAAIGGAAQWPQGVPDDFVVTPNGYSHPSCIVTLEGDEQLGSDLVIRGRDGVEHARAAPCVHPRFGRYGQRIEPHVAPQVPAPAVPAPSGGSQANGWVAQYTHDGPVNEPSLVDRWVVPPLPSQVHGQTLFFFNGIQGIAILQPVLAMDSKPPWTLSSWSCCVRGYQQQSRVINVNPGDVIRGTVTSSNCDASNLCQNWTVTSLDETTGQSVVLNAGPEVGIPHFVVPAVLETYGVTSCDMFPATGELTFFNNLYTSHHGQVDNLMYKLLVEKTGNGRAGNLPACGYGGRSDADSYTLIFSTSPTGGGTQTDGSVEDASADVDAAGGAAVDGTNGRGPEAGGARDASPRDGASAVGDALATPTGGTGGRMTTPSGGESGGASGAGGRSAPSPGGGGLAIDGGGSPMTGLMGSEGGCGCRLNASRGGAGSPWTAMAAQALAAALLFSRCRRRH